MVTSTSTPGSMLMEVICFTISDGLWRSITRLWTRIWKRSQVFDPSPQGVLRVVMRRILVGILTGPFTRRFCFFAPLIRSVHTARTIRYLGYIVKLIYSWNSSEQNKVNILNVTWVLVKFRYKTSFWHSCFSVAQFRLNIIHSCWNLDCAYTCSYESN